MNSMKKNMVIAFVLAMLSLLICSCGSDFFESSDDSGKISGVAQKGPFLKGSKVSLHELDPNMVQTGVSFYTTVDDSMGHYHLDNVLLTNRYAWMQVDGFFISEISEERSNQSITLNSLVDLQGSGKINVNILGHLAFERERYLVQKGASIEEAKKQAEAEVLEAFNMGGDATFFEKMDIQGSKESDAKLLAVAVLMMNGTDATGLVERMASFAFDIEEDGVWDDESLKQEIRDLAISLGVYGVRKIRLKVNEITGVSAPAFEKYLGSFAAFDYTYIPYKESDTGKPSTIYELVEDPYLSTWEAYYPDRRDGHYYRVIKIGNQVWMSEFLAYKGLDRDLVVMYSWDEAKSACPDGWLIPQKKNLDSLFTMRGGLENALQGFEPRRFWTRGTSNGKYAFVDSEFVKVVNNEKFPVICQRHDELLVYGNDPSKTLVSSPPVNPSTKVFGEVTDSRDSNVYKTVTIGNATWMAENLKYKIPGEEMRCYGNDPANCEKYGFVYNDNGVTLKDVCPSGWRAADAYEWRELFGLIGISTDTLGAGIKSDDGWGGIANYNRYGINVLALPNQEEVMFVPSSRGCVDFGLACTTRIAVFTAERTLVRSLDGIDQNLSGFVRCIKNSEAVQ